MSGQLTVLQMMSGGLTRGADVLSAGLSQAQPILNGGSTSGPLGQMLQQGLSSGSATLKQALGALP